MAENVMRSVTALTVCRDEETFLADGVSVDGVHVLRIDIGEMVLLGHRRIPMTLAAGGGYVERVDGGLGIVLGENGVGSAVAGGAGMVGGMLMHAADDGCGFVCVAGDALDRLRVFGMRVGGDGGVAGAALESAVHAGVERVAVDANVVACGVLHGDVAMAGEAVRLRVEMGGEAREEQSDAG